MLENSIFGEVSYSITEFEWEGALGWAVIRGWTIIRINTVLCQNNI